MAEHEIGLRISLKDRQTTARDLARIEDQVEDVGDAAARSGRQADKAARGWSRMRGGLGAVARGAGILGGALAVAGAAGGKALYNIGGTFDDMSDTIRVGTGATGRHLGALESSAKRVGRAVPVAFEDIAPVVADVNTRLGLTGPKLEKVAKQILEAGRITGEAVDVNAVSAAFNVFDVRGKQTSGAMDELYRVSQATGVGINELATSVGKNGANLKQFGFDLAESAGLIGTLDKAGLDGNKTLTTLSRAMVGFAKDGRDPQQALRDTVGELGALTKAGKDAAAINLAGEVFGTRGAGQFVAAIKAGKVDLDALTKATGTSSDTILKAGRDTADFAEHWQKFKNRALLQFEPVAKRVFGALGDGMKTINRDVVPAVKTFIGQMRTGQGVGGKVARVFTTVRDALARVADVIRGALAGSAGDASTYLSDIVDTFKSVVSIVQSLWERFGGTITRYTVATFQNLKQVIGGALRVISGIFETVAALLRGDWAGAWNGIKRIASGAADIVAGVVKQLWNYVRTAFSVGMGAVKGLFSGLWGGLKSLTSRGVDSIVAFVRKLPGRIADVATGAFDGLKDAFRGAVNWVIDAWNGLSFSLPGFDPPGPGPKFDGLTIGTPNIPRLAAGGIVTARPGGILANIGEGRYDEAVVPMNGRSYLVNGSGVTSLPPMPSVDLALDDLPETLGGAARRTLHVHLDLDGRQIGEAILDDFDNRAARR